MTFAAGLDDLHPNFLASPRVGQNRDDFGSQVDDITGLEPVDLGQDRPMVDVTIECWGGRDIFAALARRPRQVPGHSVSSVFKVLIWALVWNCPKDFSTSSSA